VNRVQALNAEALSVDGGPKFRKAAINALNSPNHPLSVSCNFQLDFCLSLTHCASLCVIVCVREREGVKTGLGRSMLQESLKGHHRKRERELATERQDILIN
jgi:hypothetical protein